MRWIEENMEHNLAMKPTDDDVDLLALAADIMRRNHEKQAEAGAKAQTIMSQAQEELKIVERLLQESEAARVTAEMEVKKAKAKLEEMENVYETRLVLVEQERSALELCVQSAERRAKAAEESLARLRTGFRSLLKRYEEGYDRQSDRESVPSPSTAPDTDDDPFLRAAQRRVPTD
jgi:hypothetical protein